MNDNDIIKALEYCVKYDESCDECRDECPLIETDYCTSVLRRKTLDLINRLEKTNRKNERIIELADKTIETQKAEIERLQNAYKQCAWERDIFLDELKTAKSEAIKEFAERLKEEATVDDDSTWWVANIDIDNLVKEMTEVNE